MYIRNILATVLVVICAVAEAAAAEMPELAKHHQCVNCHMLDKQFVGPAWREVADKYKGDANAPATLSEKIAKGGKGVWGPIPMPDNPQISEADRTELVSFILGLAK